MKLEIQHIEHIKLEFAKMQTNVDFLRLLNYVKVLKCGEKAYPFKMDSINYYLSLRRQNGKSNFRNNTSKKYLTEIQFAEIFGIEMWGKDTLDEQRVTSKPKDFSKLIKGGERITGVKLNGYNKFLIKKKSGAARIIHAPSNGLKEIQKCINIILQVMFSPHIAATGFVNGKSIVDNAKIHCKQNYVYNIDLKDFFPSIEQARFWKRLQCPPFNLKPQLESKDYVQLVLTEGVEKAEAKKNERLRLANTIASLCFTEIEVERKNADGIFEKVKRNVLPQGAPTSPTISNIICERLDRRLSGLAKRFGLNYSRYADDITFSTMHSVYGKSSEFIKELYRIIADQNFDIKESKTRLQRTGYKQEVTGLVVNQQANVNTRYVKELRMWIYLWEKYGFNKTYNYFVAKYKNDKGHVKKGKPDMANVLSGKLEYLKMVKGADNELYKKLKSRFDKRIDTNIKTKTISESEIITQNDTNEVRITLEVHQFPEMNEKLYNSINIPKDTVLPSTIIVQNSNLEVTTIKDESIYPIIHNPSTTVSLLKYFTANDKNLKYSTHSWEEGKYDSYEDFLSKISFEWNEIKDEIKKQSKRLHAKISSFLFNNKLGKKNEKGFYEVWGENRLKFGWSLEELIIHMSEPGNSPFSCPIPEHIKQLDKKYNLHYFKDYAEVFKNEIEFREDSNNFKKMILDIWENELGYDFKLNGLEQLVGFSLFTDVALVKASVVKIFEMFKGKPHYPVISVEKNSSFENRGYHLFRITQIDSFVTRSIDDPKITNPTGNLNTVIEQLKNLSDYSIVSRFQDGNTYRINYLSSSITSEFIVKLPDNETALGITHELKFYL